MAGCEVATTVRQVPRRPAWRRLFASAADVDGGGDGGGVLLAASRTLAAKVRGGGRGAAQLEGWQAEAAELYHEVGELRFVAQQFAGAGSQARLYPARWDASAGGWVEVVDGPVADVWADFAGGPQAQAELVRRMLAQLFVVGETYLVGLPPGVLDGGQPQPDPPVGRLDWLVVSAGEVSERAGQLVLARGDRQVVAPADDCVLVRVWRPSPFGWWAADSPVRSVLPVLRELVGLTKHVAATIDSRLAGAGLLVVGQGFSSLGTSGEHDGDEAADPLLGELIDTAATAIADRDSAAAVVPVVLQGPDDAVDKVRHLSFATPFDAATRELRDEAIRRLALGLDAPPEVLLGMSGSSHWNAWLIEEDYVRTQIGPALQLVADALTADFLRPVVAAQGIDPAAYSVGWDAAALTRKPDRSKAAQVGYEAGVLSAETLRDELGFDEADAPDRPEVDEAVRMALDLVRDSPALLVEPGLGEVVRQIGALLDGGDVPAPATGAGGAGEDADDGQGPPSSDRDGVEGGL